MSIGQQAVILVPLDGSETSEMALPHASTLAKLTGSSLCLLWVLQASTPPPPGSVRQLQERYLERMAAVLRQRGLAVGTRVATGNPAASILRVAEQMETALIVLTSHGHGGARRWLLGETTKDVLCRSRLPVLMIPAMPRRPYGQRPLLRRLLVPLDGSPAAEWALPWGSGLATMTGASLLLVTVVPQKLYGLGPYESLPSLAPDRSVVAQAAGDYLDGVRKQLVASVAVQASVLKGAAAPAIVEYGVRQGVDMVIMSTHGFRQPSQAILANTIDRVVRSGLPVLIVPPDDRHPRLSIGQMLAEPAILAAA